METALVLLVPEAEAIVSSWRARYDTSAAEGVPAHITVLVPFMAYEKIDAACRNTLREIIAGCGALNLTFLASKRFPDTIWLAPEPDEPIRKLSQALVAQFPDYPLYGGAFDVIVPHLTVAQGEAAVLDEVEADLSARLTTPLKARIESCTLFSHEPGRWRDMEQFRLGS